MSKSFESTCDQATKANSGYSVELFESGVYCVFPNSQIGTQTDSQRFVLSVPVLDEEWLCEDPFYSFYDDAEHSIREAFEQKMADIASQQKKLQNP